MTKTLNADQKRALTLALLDAVDADDADLAKMAIERGGDPNIIVNTDNKNNKFRRPLLAYAVEQAEDDMSVIDVLLQGGAKLDDVRKDDSIKETALVHALREQKYAVFSHLLNKGADPNAKSSAGNVPLAMVLKQKRPDLARDLLQKGARPLEPCADGKTPLEVLRNADIPEEEKAGLRRLMLAKLPVVNPVFGEAAASPALALGQDIVLPERLVVRKPAPPGPAAKG